MSTWRYRWEPEGVVHLGPMAQDFRQAFGLGSRDDRICVVDAVGVALAGVQALEERVTALDAAAGRRPRRAGAAVAFAAVVGLGVGAGLILARARGIHGAGEQEVPAPHAPGPSDAPGYDGRVTSAGAR